MTRSLEVHWLGVAASGVLALWLAGSGAPAFAQGSGTDIPLIVLVDDGEEHALSRRGGIVQEALDELRDQLSRYGYDVKTEEILAANFDWDLSGRLDTTELLRIAYAAKESGRPELDTRAVVIFSVHGITKDQGFATNVELTLRGSIYDAEAQRQLSRFGPLSRSSTAPANCAESCVEQVGRPIANELAAIAGDEARKELAQLTKQPRAGASGSSSAGQTTAAYEDGLTTIFAIRFENFTTNEMFEVIEVMEQEFPGFVRSRDIEGTPVRATYGYISRAPSSKIYRWINILLMDMGLDPDSRVQVVKRGTEITLKKLGGDEPGGSAPQGARFE
ncbi:MAG: hypothetical protein JRG96_20330 [Deltaproteobacteria bacterium]|nr:hypothetical protein [Deltaproteobacteria bacterium]